MMMSRIFKLFNHLHSIKSLTVVLFTLYISFDLCCCFNFETTKVVIHKPTFSQNTHFGFTVAGYKVDNDPWLVKIHIYFKTYFKFCNLFTQFRILVGAPLTLRERHHSQSIKTREGAVYRCRINNPNNCYMLPFDKKDWNEARDHYGFYHSENKTDQLLGATLTVSDDVILACAPNYRYVTRIMRQDEFRYEPTGTCFTLKDRMRKFEEHSPCRNGSYFYIKLLDIIFS